ncbi:MAG: zf-HC2 domain-containing protein [Acidobacteriota bacterium]
MTLSHIDDRRLSLYFSDQLDPEQRIFVQLHLRHCAACRNRVEADASTQLAKWEPPSLERPFSSGQLGSVQALSPLSLDKTAIQITDVSAGGFGVIADTSLPAGAIVQVRIGNSVALGEVRYCRAAGNNRFHAGVFVKGGCELPV